MGGMIIKKKKSASYQQSETVTFPPAPSLAGNHHHTLSTYQVSLCEFFDEPLFLGCVMLLGFGKLKFAGCFHKQ